MNSIALLDRRTALAAGIALFAGGGLTGCRPPNRGKPVVRYGITPYQDSALPMVAATKGWYEADGLDVRPVPLSWDQVMAALTGGAIDVAIYNFNSFIPPYAAAAAGKAKPLVYAPLYVFKGQAIMVHGDKGLRTLAGATQAELPAIAAQLKGRRIGLTRGTELEQIVLAALKAGGLTERDATLIHAAPEDNLAAFLSGDLDAFAAGLTERVEARRRGGVELITQADVLSPVTDALVTTEAFAAAHPDVLDKLILSWFRTIDYIAADIRKNSAEIREYLRTSASTVYSPEEYEIAWSFNVFPKTAKEAAAMFSDASPFGWRKSWDDVNKFLLEQKKIAAAAPYTACRGTVELARLSTSAAKTGATG